MILLNIARTENSMDGIIIMKNSDKNGFGNSKISTTADLKVTDRIMRCYWHRE